MYQYKRVKNADNPICRRRLPSKSIDFSKTTININHNAISRCRNFLQPRSYILIELMDNQRHPLLEYPEVERVDYLSVIASLASADGKVTDSEIVKIREFCERIDIHGFGISLIIAAVEDPSVVDLASILPRMAQTDLKFTLLADLLFMAHADGRCSTDEQQEIHKIAAMLTISPEQIEAINAYVETVLRAASKKTKHSDADWKRIGREIASVLASAGVPLGAVVIAGSVFGTGLTSGVAALGMGLGLTTGIGVAVSLGVGSYFGVRWLCKKLFGTQDE